MKYNFSIQSIGERKFSSPLKISRFTHDENRLLFKTHIDNYAALKDDNGDPLSVELAGPRSKIFFKPAETKAVIVTCGGLCPGINDVIRSITLTLFHRYNVTEIWGANYGLRGLNPDCGHEMIRLTPEFVDNITS
ncbi:MAG: ATP-dependent 6-phosphofructokinase, partial [Deltaproteobacteria bacterium]|nr:ATP-dependent 6-phosphofructokinase [Deltaproteobacteria bacterium]